MTADLSRGRGPARGVALAVVALGISGLAVTALANVALAAWQAVTSSGPARFDDAITAPAAGVAAVLVGWLGTAVAFSALAAVSTHRRRLHFLQPVSRRLAPRTLRHLVAALAGATIVGLAAPGIAQADTGLDPGWPAGRPAAISVGPEPGSPAGPPRARRAVSAATVSPATVSPATVSPPTVTPPTVTQRTVPGPITVPGTTVDATWAATAQVRATQGLDPGWVPARPPRPTRRPTASQLPATTLRPGLLTEHEVVVHRGDTLWQLVRRQLGPAATNAQIAAEWPRWYAANRAVIGPDPDHLEPGQRLRPPTVQDPDRYTAPHRYTTQERTSRR